MPGLTTEVVTMELFHHCMSYRLRKIIRITLKSIKILGNWPEKQLYRIGLISTRNLCLPDFLIIGAPKAGTWWLAENLGQHPQVYLAKGERRGELHYFDQAFHKSLISYSHYFEPGRGKVKGEKTPAYSLLSMERIQFIRRVMPQVRLLYLIRNPIDRSWSHALMDLVRSKGVKVEDVPSREFKDHFQRHSSKGNYLEIIDRWLTQFHSEQFLVCFFDDIIHRPRILLSEAFQHIGVSTDVEWCDFPYNRKINTGPGAGIPKELCLILEEMHQDQLTALQRRFGNRVAEWQPD